MTARVTHTQTYITRVLKAAKAAGMHVARCELTLDGRIVLSEQQEQPVSNPLDQWKAKREGKSPGR